MVLREILLLAIAGMAIGVPATLMGSRLVGSLLFGVKGTDPFSLAAAVGVMLAVTVLAAYLPARRASRIEPAVALRCE
jgi:macrolide transport system ATP-binding/permease protein